MKAQSGTRPYDSINVTPMLDLAYVLLVVFVIMATVPLQGLNLDLPKPSHQPRVDQPPPHILQINAQGQVLLDGVGKTQQELQTSLSDLHQRDAQAYVLIKGMSGNEYSQVMVLVDMCEQLHVNMGLITSRFGT